MIHISDYIAAPAGWVARVAEGNYRSVVAFSVPDGEPVIVPRPDLGDEGDVAVSAPFFDITKVPGEPS